MLFVLVEGRLVSKSILTCILKNQVTVVRLVNVFCNDQNDGNDGTNLGELFGVLACFVLFALYIKVPFLFL